MHHNDPMCDLGVGDGVVQLPGDLPAQQMDGVQGVLDFAAAVGPLHGQEAPAHLDEGQAQLAQQAQVGHRPGGGEIEPLPDARASAWAAPRLCWVRFAEIC